MGGDAVVRAGRTRGAHGKMTGRMRSRFVAKSVAGAAVALLLAHCVWPMLVATMLGGLLAGGMQTRFQTSPEALELNWERMNPVAGFQRLFSMRSAAPWTRLCPAMSV